MLDAAHIIPDANEQLGQPVVPNGLPLSKIHHAAFDAYLIGIDPDYRVHVSDRLLEQHDDLSHGRSRPRHQPASRVGKAAGDSVRHPRRDDPGRLLCFEIRGYVQLEQVATIN